METEDSPLHSHMRNVSGVALSQLASEQPVGAGDPGDVEEGPTAKSSGFSFI